MLEFLNCSIDKIIVHKVGNKTNQDDLQLSKTLLEAEDEKLKDLLIRYFLHPFSQSEFNSFTFSNEDFTLNPLYQFATKVFDNKNSFTENSIHIAKHLFEIAIHPQIKSGDLFIVTFSNIILGGERLSGLGIFKSENKQPFLKLDRQSDDYYLHYEDGINIEKLDKGCLILNTDKDSGYKVCVVDKSSKAGEAQFWREAFLNIKPFKDEYHFTKQFLNITKNYVTLQLDEEFEVNKADKIDLLNRSVDYFKTHESFDKKEFEKDVLQDTGIIKSFRKYDESYREDNNLELADNFEISSQAVKKQARVFKSVLKLDKNFHIYIHGDRELIEQGIDKDGRKYYKIYYKEEN
jgi:37-kD nucleoid-associated bacterial protein